jgi:hypothetical protein
LYPEAIPTTPPNTLRTGKLHMVDMSPGILGHILGDHAGSLERLEIVSCSQNHDDPFVHPLAAFRKLKVLHLYDNSPKILDPWDLPACLNSVHIDWLLMQRLQSSWNSARRMEGRFRSLSCILLPKVYDITNGW